MLLAVGRGGWKEAIQHDGYVVVRLRLFTPEEGGQNRHVQSGLRAAWIGPGDRPLPGLLELPDHDVRSIAPGAEEIVHVRPLEPSSWREVQTGTELGFCKNWPRRLGEGLVLERVGVPYERVPPRFRPPRGVPLRRRKPTLAERLRLRRHGRE